MRAAWPMVLLRKIVKNFYKMPKDLASSGNLKRRDKKRNKKKRKEKRTLHNHSLTPIHPKFFLFFFFFFFSLSLSLSLSLFSLPLFPPHASPSKSHSVQVAATHTDFDCVYLVGGHGCCVDFAGEQAVALVAVVNAQYAAGKLVAADCHGPYGLIDCTKADGTPLVAGLEVTAFSDSEEKAAGAMEWVLGNAVSMEQKFTEQGESF